MKKFIKVLLCILFPLGILYLLMLRCQKRAWPEGMKSVRYAHRGLHHQPDAPENSLAAFRAAVEHGFGAELDVHLMKDGGLAVIHDSSLARTAGADVNIEDLSTEDLENYRLEGTEEKIPLLEEAYLPEGFRYVFDTSTPSCRLLNQPYDPADTVNTQYYVIDGFIVSPNVAVDAVETLDLGFENSDHNPVLMTVNLIP